MKITIIAVGKLKEKYMKAAVDEYVKRLSRYAKVDVLEVADEPAGERLSAAQAQAVKQAEGARILRQVKEGAYVIATAIAGKPLDSVAFAGKLAGLAVDGVSHVCFVIGGSLGLCESVLARADFLLSFSAMTFPHQLMRVMLAEQVYRAFRIGAGEPYHK